jgi:hypothetical protein
MNNTVNIDKKGLSKQVLNDITNLIHELSANHFKDRNKWIVDEIIETITDISKRVDDPDKLFSTLLDEYNDKGYYNEQVIDSYPPEATVGKTNLRTENEILIKKIQFLEIVSETFKHDQMLSDSFFSVNLYKKGFTSLPAIVKLQEKGILYRTVFQYIHDNQKVVHVIALFHHLGFLEHIKKDNRYATHIDVAKEVHSWIRIQCSLDTVTKSVRYYMNNGSDDKQYDFPLQLVQDNFPL